MSNNNAPGMTVEEGNIIIAEFMGRKFKPYKSNSSYNSDYDTYALCRSAIEENKWVGYTPQLGWKIGVGKYHSSWDWLNPVWKKFWDMANKVCFGAARSKEYEMVVGIRRMYMACVDENDIVNAQRILSDGIKWYNTQISKQ